MFTLGEDELGTHGPGKYALTNVGTENAPVYKIQSVVEDTNTNNSYDHVFANGSVQIDVTNSSQAGHLLSEVSSLESSPHVQIRPTPSASNEMPDNGAIIHRSLLENGSKSVGTNNSIAPGDFLVEVNGATTTLVTVT